MLERPVAALGRGLNSVDSSILRRLPPLNEDSANYARRADAFIHPTAIVAADARLGSRVVVGPLTVVEGGAHIGEGTQIGAHSVIKRFTAIGARCRIYTGVVLGDDPQDVGFSGVDTFLEIGDEVVIREGVVIHRASRPGHRTIVGNHCYLMKGVHVSHDCEIGERVGMASHASLAGYACIESDAYVMGHARVIERCRIGRAAMVGAMSKVVQDVLPFCLADGVPARLVGLHTSAIRRAQLPREQICNLKLAYRLLSARGPELDGVLETLARLGDPLVDELVTFVRSSKRGFCRARRAATRPAPQLARSRSV
jgi:UDP-N-acetylglucosamine acyltransferase